MTMWLLRFGLVLALIGCAGPGPRTRPPAPPVGAFNVERAIYGIIVDFQPPGGRWGGTAFAIEHYAAEPGQDWTLLVTCKHVISEEEIGRVSGLIVMGVDIRDGSFDAWIARFVTSSVDTDLSVVAIRGRRPKLNIQAKEWKPDDSDVVIVGRPGQGRAAEYARGDCFSERPIGHPEFPQPINSYPINTETRGGFSGAPVLEIRSTAVVGVLWGGAIKGAWSYAVPIYEIYNVLERARTVIKENAELWRWN